MPKERPVYVGKPDAEYLSSVDKIMEWTLAGKNVSPDHMEHSRLLNEMETMRIKLLELEQPPENVPTRRWPIKTKKMAKFFMHDCYPEDFNERPYSDVEVARFRHDRMEEYLTEIERAHASISLVIAPDEFGGPGGVAEYDPMYEWGRKGPRTRNISPYIEYYESMLKRMDESDIPCPICGCRSGSHEYEQRDGQGFDVLVGIKCTGCGKMEGLWKREGF
jgi:hypothetical protein